jgi:cobalt/nickel transport system permease protein
MGAMAGSYWLPWAVHISDGVLSAPWLAGGFVLAGLLALLASYRVRDEEVPRIALLSAAFFVASLLHVRLGPTSVHLLLNGLVGVVLGRRAPLAILIGLGLQAALLGHGGFTTIGINACVMTLPALLAGWMFAALRRLHGTRPQRRTLLWIVGCFLGVISVLCTLILDAVVLLWGGAENWHQIVWLVFYAHLPIVAVEGVVLGFTVSFLASVKPEMLGIIELDLPKWRMSESATFKSDEDGITSPSPNVTRSASYEANSIPSSVSARPPALLLAIFTTLLAAGHARAHRLDAAFFVLPDRQVRIESWFDLGGVPNGAKVQVFRPGAQLLAEGQLDEQGCFVFRFMDDEPLEVIVSAGAGHRKSFVIPREDLEQPGGSSDLESNSTIAKTNVRLHTEDRDTALRERFKDALIGISFVLALAAFFLSWRNARRLKSMRP